MRTTPSVDWTYLCDLAYFDADQQLCMIGIDTREAIRTLPTGVYRFTIVARFASAVPDGLDVTVSMVAPPRARVPETPLQPCADLRGEYLLITFGSVPYYDEGIYRFEIAFDSTPAFNIPLVISNSVPARTFASYAN